jgi:hypothetical protein
MNDKLDTCPHVGAGCVKIMERSQRIRKPPQSRDSTARLIRGNDERLKISHLIGQ